MAPLIIHLSIRYGKWLALRSTLLLGKALRTLSGCEAGILVETGSQFGRFGKIKNLLQNNTNINSAKHNIYS